MFRLILQRLVLVFVGVLCLAASAVLAQTALAQLKLTDADARAHVLTAFGYGGGALVGLPDHIVLPARNAYATIPASARGAVTTGLYAWTKSYVNTAAFKTAYAAMRKENTPEPFRAPTTTVDEELKSQLAGFAKAGVKESPELVKSMRQNIEDERAKKKGEAEAVLKEWQEKFPADPMTVVARSLRAFVANTADVDFSAKTRTERAGARAYLVFDNDAYNKKPWQWQEAYLYGPETLAAARAAATAWLKELPVK